jgi:hypothetical protein
MSICVLTRAMLQMTMMLSGFVWASKKKLILYYGFLNIVYLSAIRHRVMFDLHVGWNSRVSVFIRLLLFDMTRERPKKK